MSIRLTAALLIVVVASTASPGRAAIGTEFTYQGRLANAGSAANGLHDLRFRLYDASSFGSQVGAVVCLDNVSVSDGLFTVSLDFGAQFTGEARFLEIEVRADTGLNCVTPTGFVVLSPRHAVTSAPNALFAAIATNATQLNGQPAFFYMNVSNFSIGTLADARLSNNIPRLNSANVFGNFENNFMGDVGIGTSTPAGRLHVHEGSAGAIAPHSNSSTVLERSGNNYLQMYAPDPNESGLLFGNATQDIRAAILADANNAVLFRTGGNTTRMTLDAAGNLGIGTTSPNAPLEVNDTSGRIRINSTLSPGVGSVLEFRNATLLNTQTGAVNFVDVAGVMEGQMSYGENGLSFSSGGATRMTVNLAGNVGIGTSNPTGKLHVVAPSGDASVVLPTSSIAKSEILDEPGIAARNREAFTFEIHNNTPTSVASRTITPPADGYVVVLATLKVTNLDVNTTKNFSMCVTQVADLSGEEYCADEDLSNPPLNFITHTVTIHSVFVVTGGTAETFHLVARSTSGADPNISTFEPRLTIMYFSSAHGLVEAENP